MDTKRINFCKNSNVFICNGRIGADKYHGSLTNVKGKTIVDYLICSLNILPCITHFCITTFNEVLSDIHCSLSCTCQCKYVLNVDFNNDL